MALNHDAPGQERAGTGELDQLRQGSTLGRAMARSVGDRNFMILAGTTIPCVLLTAMDTATPGYVSCVVPTDVYSDNGAVVLLEKGSRVLGEYRSAMRQGQRRLFVLWTRAVTPGGVAIALASPGVDALGRAGFDGAVDNHFWTRFGGALMLSIVDDAVFAAAGRQDSSQIVRPSSDAAAVALEGSIGVGPSLTKAQGEKVTIFAAQDFDFSNVYDLRSR
jgi:type IV secretion system protein VirB10